MHDHGLREHDRRYLCVHALLAVPPSKEARCEHAGNLSSGPGAGP